MHNSDNKKTFLKTFNKQKKLFFRNVKLKKFIKL